MRGKNMENDPKKELEKMLLNEKRKRDAELKK
jgi:hypothetical protein